LIDVTPFNHCVCKRVVKSHGLCEGQFSFAEKGKKIKLIPRSGEQVASIVLDGCVFQDDRLKCDGLFLFIGHNQKAAILVELKGAWDIPHAFEQLSYVKRHRSQYQSFVKNLCEAGPGQLREKAFIVSNGILSKTEKEKLENQYGIRVAAILTCENVSSVPDLRQHL